MTMVPSRHALLQLEELSHQIGSDPLLKTKDYDHSLSLFASDTTNCIASDLTIDHMQTEQDSLSTSRNDEPGSCSRPFDHEDNGLQLGLAGQLVPAQEAELARSRNLVELDLLPAKSTGSMPPPSDHIPDYPVHPPHFFLHPDGTAGFGFRQPEYFWNFRHMPYSSSTWNVQYTLPGIAVAAAKPGPSSSLMKIVNAPPQPNSGLWFVLQAEQNQIKELALPQVQKSYLRIKDRKMTMLLIMKYLAKKLHLESESEVEIRCRGQRVLPSQTVQHVRDAIWRREQGLIKEPPLTSLPRSSTTGHLMILHYSRSYSPPKEIRGI